jgi:hypothetical protein
MPGQNYLFILLDDRCELAEAISTVAAGDKLGGWQRWSQGVEYPSCPRSAARMVLVFQLDSEDNLHLVFGDSGHAVRGQPGRFVPQLLCFVPPYMGETECRMRACRNKHP